MDRLLTLIRRPNEIVACVSRKQGKLTITPEALAQMPFHDETSSLYTVAEMPLALLPGALYGRKDSLLAAWNALQTVRSLDAETLSSVLTVLIETVGEDEGCDLPMPSLLMEAEPRPILPTAAHPRAYRGTKTQPPKPRQMPITDLRSALCDRRSPSLLAAKIDAHRDDIGVRMEQRGYDPPFLTALSAGADLYLAAHYNASAVPEFPSLPTLFSRWMLPLLKGCAWPVVTDYLALYWQLGLERKPALLHAIVRLLSFQNNALTLQWCRLLAEQPEETHLTFATLLLESEAYRLDITPLTAQDRAFVLELYPGPFYAYRLYSLFTALHKGIALDYLRCGYHLADSLDPDYRFHEVEQSGYYPQEKADRLMTHIQAAEDYSRVFQIELGLWRRCGDMDGLGTLVESIPWTRYAPDTASDYLSLYTDRFYDRDNPSDALWKAKWCFIRGQVQQIESLLSDTPPEYQRKCLGYISDGFWYWDEFTELATHMPSLYLLLRRLARSPYTTNAPDDPAVCALVGGLNAEESERLLNAPEVSFRRMEQACCRKNDVYLIRRGFLFLTRLLPTFVVYSFIERPTRLFRVVRLLGCLSEALRNQVIREFATSPRYGQGAILTQLEALEQKIVSVLGAGFQADMEKDEVRHAMQMRMFIDDNRRGLRKFLRAYWNGRHDYILTHPRTQAWLKKHPNLSSEIWLRGISYSQSIESHGILHLSLEQDPLEKLKLGTYVGSCLGIGGLCAYSAVAAVLDINKQVLYARNHRGSVIARQMVAISEQEELVCFEVYPHTIETEVKRMFQEADTQLAQNLGLKLYRPEPDRGYNIANILSEYWWDDRAWDFKRLKDE